MNDRRDAPARFRSRSDLEHERTNLYLGTPHGVVDTKTMLVVFSGGAHGLDGYQAEAIARLLNDVAEGRDPKGAKLVLPQPGE